MSQKSKNLLIGAFAVLALLGLAKYLGYKLVIINSELEGARTEIQELEKELNKLRTDKEKLEMLSSSDKELLKKYSKVYFLNEHYIPGKLSDIDAQYVFKGTQNFQIHSKILPYLRNLLADSSRMGMELRVTSGYRSFGTQADLKATYIQIYGAGTANQFSADQGYSEHQLGSALDFTTVKLNGSLEGFDQSPEYQWLLSNAHKYGFTISYPLGNGYYKFEPWHWRFVGVELATHLKEKGMNFYQMNQTEIDGYLPKIFD